MNTLIKSTMPLLCAATLLAACSSMGWGQKSSGSTHTMTGGAEAAPTSEATPKPAKPRGDLQPGAGDSSGGTSGSTSGSTSGTSSGSHSGGASGTGASGTGGTGASSGQGDASTGGAEGAPTPPRP